MPVVLPDRIENGDLLDADAVMAQVDALASKFTEGDGGIGDDDFTGNAGRKLDGAKIADGSIPTAAIGVEQVTDTRLAFDAVDPGLDAGRAVSGDHIKTLTAAHLARIMPSGALAGIGTDKLKVTLATAAISMTTGLGGTVVSAPLTLSGTFAAATYDCLGFFVNNIGGTAAATCLVFLHASNSATNWALAAHAYSNAGGTVTGTAIVVFISKL